MTNDITKHKDWQKWRDAAIECEHWAPFEILSVCAPLIFAAGREAEHDAAKQWLPIDTAPKDDETILGAKGKIPFAMSWASEDACWYNFYGWYEQCLKRQVEPTHWMPLPAPPIEKE